MAGKKPQGLENAKYTKRLKMPARELGIIGLTTSDGEEHPDYDPRILLPLDEAMVNSIDERGVDKAVDIAVIDGAVFVIDGRRRTMHAWAALDRHTPAEQAEHPAAFIECKLWHLTDAERARFAIVANAHRLNDDPVTEAEKAHRLSKQFGVSDEQICTDFGWSIGTLRNRRKLIDGSLPKSVLDMVRSGKLLVSAALKLKGQSPEEALQAAKELAAGGTSKQGARAKATKTDGVARPGIRLLAKIVANEEAAPEAERHLDENVRQAIKWALGELQPGSIKGLSAAIAATAPEPKKDRKTAAEGRKNPRKKTPPRMPPKKKGRKTS
jgi:ParB family transcriptional regulator, chromosome partitioning protein